MLILFDLNKVFQFSRASEEWEMVSYYADVSVNNVKVFMMGVLVCKKWALFNSKPVK